MANDITMSVAKHTKSGNATQAHKNRKTLPARDSRIISQIVQAFVDRSRKGIDKWRAAIKQAEDPYSPSRVKLHALYGDLEMDTHFISQQEVRKLTTLSKPFKIIDKKTGEENKDKTRLLQTPWFYDFMSHALDSIFYGTQIIEFDDLEEGEFKGVSLLPRWSVLPERKEIITQVYQQRGIPYNIPEYEPWLIEIKERRKFGLLCALAPQLIWKKNAQQAWAEFSQRFGQPYRTALTNSRDMKDIARIEKMLDEMGEAAWGLFPEGTTIDFREFKTGDAFNVFDAQIERCNSEISKAVNGVTMISDNGASLSQSKVHENVNGKIIQADMTNLQFLINWDLLHLLNKHGYGLESFEFVWDETETLSIADRWKMVNEALHHYDIEEKWVTETFGFPIAGKKTANVNFNQGLPVNRIPKGPIAQAPTYDITCCGDHNPVMSHSDDVNDWRSEFAGIYRELYQGNSPEIPVSAYLKKAEVLKNGFLEGFKERLTIDYDSPDNYRIAMFEANIFRFSAASTFRDVIELNRLAREANGNYKEFERLASEYTEICSRALQVEFNLAVATSQNAANWLRQVEDKDDMDLMYQTIGDARVRRAHQVYDKFVAPVDDPIWNTIYPPNGWGCRCEVISIPKGSRTKSDRSTLSMDEIPAIFQVNRGKTNYIYESGHEYFKEFPEEKTLNIRKWGLEDMSTVDRSGYGELKRNIQSKDEFVRWWKKEQGRLGQSGADLYYKNYAGLSFKLPAELQNKFNKPKYREEGRFGIGEFVGEMLQRPDEVWLNSNNSNRAKYKTVYLKNYKDGLYAVVANTEENAPLEVITWYKVADLSNQELGKIRHGILIKKS